jgi:site-specific DNA-methyltransferase (adenine-specific)
MIVEQMLKNAPNPLLHIADVSGSALFQGDCLEIMPLIPDKSVQLILADLPYGTTQCKWDSVIDLDKLWIEYKRIISDNGNIVLFSDEPFTSVLICSNLEQFRQRITWDKQVAGNHLNSKKMLLKITEDICLFTPSKLGNQTYNIQLTEKPKEHRRGDRKRENRKEFAGGYVGKHNGQVSETYNEEVSYPSNLWSINSKQGECNALNRTHPTQKPLELIEKLLITYSNENDMVLDNTMGSGTTCLSAKELNRKFIGIEKEANYYEIACRRCGF